MVSDSKLSRLRSFVYLGIAFIKLSINSSLMKLKKLSFAIHACMVLLFAVGSFTSASAQNCSNPPDCIINPDMTASQNGDLNPGFSTMNGWFYSHGTPTVNTTAGVGGTGSIWMWSYSGIGEGVYSCFDFRQGRTYQICLWVRSTNGISAGNLNIFAATGLNQPAYTAPFGIATPTTSQLIDNSFVNNGAWTQLVINYTPNANYNQLWIYPFMAGGPIGGQQYELRISRVNIIERELPIGIAVPCGGDLVLTGPSQSCATGAWFDPAGNPIGTGTVVIPNADPSMNGIYKMVVRVGDCEYTLERQVMVEECNCEEFEASFDTDAPNNPTSFNETSTGPGISVGWFWEFGDGGTSNDPNPTHTYNQPGVYTVCLTVIRKVGNQTCCKRICREIEVEEPQGLKQSSIGFTTNPLNFPNNALKFIEITKGKNHFTEYRWDFGDGQTSAQQHPAHVYAKEGIYKVCLTVNNKVFDVNGNLVEQNEKEFCDKVRVGNAPYDISLGKVSVMPNPAKEQAIVNIDNIPNPNVILRSITGAEVTKGKLIDANQYLLKMDGLPVGVYIVEVESEFGTKTIKLIKE